MPDSVVRGIDRVDPYNAGLSPRAPRETLSDGIHFRLQGVNRIVQPLQFSALYYEMGLYDAMNLTIRLEALASTQVSVPVDIIRLTANGTEWIQKKRECREQE